MPTIQDTRDVAPLELGHGPAELEIFLEPTCPYSKRAFEKLPALIEAVGADKLTIRIRFLSQPWHLFSPIVTRCVLASSTGGDDAGMKTLAAIFEHREDFVCEHHCEGPNMTRSPADVVKQISGLAGKDLTEALKSRGVDRMIRWHAKYTRQTGVHSSPSFVINGIIEPGMSSGQSVEEWAELLKPYTEG